MVRDHCSPMCYELAIFSPLKWLLQRWNQPVGSDWVRWIANCWQSFCIYKLDGNYLQTFVIGWQAVQLPSNSKLSPIAYGVAGSTSGWPECEKVQCNQLAATHFFSAHKQVAVIRQHAACKLWVVKPWTRVMMSELSVTAWEKWKWCKE